MRFFFLLCFPFYLEHCDMLFSAAVEGRLRKREEDVGKDVRGRSLEAWVWERALI